MEKKLKLPIGIENFSELRKRNYYYVDKTELIEQVLEDGSQVILFTRPRRFGKSLNMSMLATVYKGNIIKNLIMDCQSYTKYRPNETTGGIFVSWRRKEELPTGA